MTVDSPETMYVAAVGGIDILLSTWSSVSLDYYDSEWMLPLPRNKEQLGFSMRCSKMRKQLQTCSSRQKAERGLQMCAHGGSEVYQAFPRWLFNSSQDGCSTVATIHRISWWRTQWAR